MKRSKRRPAQKAKPKSATAAQSQPGRRKTNRREMLRQIRDYGALGAIGLAAGWWFVSDVRAHWHEHDLTRIGDGAPAVVQIHDPDCALCRELQRETLRALEAFDDADLQYVVANIRTSDGARFANAHGVQHVTLLLFDGDGARRDVIVGTQTSAVLKRRFQRHLDALDES